MTTFSPEDYPNRFDFSEAQPRIYKFWEERGYFNADPNPDKPQHTIMIPLPNVTGALHMGHALNGTVQDLLTRWRRLQGYEALWMPGTDHAGIATQSVVERRMLEEEGLTRHDIGREELVQRIWKWKDAYEERILNQLKELGASCDWRRTRFTLDELCSRAVRRTFFKLFKDGLIYRGKRLVNWDTYLQTAVADDEVFHDETQGSFWHIRYPVVDPQEGEPEFITIATTRPETMLGDTAVAVHPDPAKAFDKIEAELTEKLAAASAKEKESVRSQLDGVRERRESMLPQLKKLRDMALDGRQVTLPLMDREIPLIADEWAKPELGSGCVKITPGHDQNDHDVRQRHPEIGIVDLLNDDGTMNATAKQYEGLTVEEARKKVIDDLVALKLHDPETDREDRLIDLAHSDRSKTPIEPRRADQWFVKMADLAENALEAVRDGRVTFYPKRYDKTYLDWLGEKRDWCISRQLWWGHRIPVWTAPLSFGGIVSATENTIDESRKTAQSEAPASLRKYLLAVGFHDSEFHVQVIGDDLFCCGVADRIDDALRALNDFKDEIEQSDDREMSKFRVNGFETATEAALGVGRLIFPLEHDPDVLDTWFSSALWPHATLGWPTEDHNPPLAGESEISDSKSEVGTNQVLDFFYPGSVLVTSRDIITLWVARMVLTGLYNMGDIPFAHVCVHPKILDGFGQTMSKSKGNGVDPMDLMATYGTDALRFTIASFAGETQDVRLPMQYKCPHCDATVAQKLDKNGVMVKPQTLKTELRGSTGKPKMPCPSCKKESQFSTPQYDPDPGEPIARMVSERFEYGRNFCNKLWNASRFALLNLTDFEPGPVADDELAVEDRWILSRLASVTQQTTDWLGKYRFDYAAQALYDFAWDEFCSFYIEMVKGRLQDDQQKQVAGRVLAHTLDSLLRLLHPMMPFVTEEIWQMFAKIAPERGLPEPQTATESIMIASWPEADLQQRDETIEARFAQFQQVLGALREIRNSQNIPPKQSVEFSIRCDEATSELLQPMESYFARMAKATCVGLGPNTEPPKPNATVSLPGMEVYLDLKDFIDTDAEKARLEKELGKTEGLIAGKEKKLGNANFVERAPADVVQRERDNLAQLQDQLATINSALDDLRSA